MDLKLIIFDLDNTLWDFETNSRIALQELLPTVDNTIDFNDFHKRYVEINYRYWRDYERGKINKNHLRYGRFYDAFEAYGIRDKERIDKMADNYLYISPKQKTVFENTYEILNYLKPKYKMAIITNGFNEVVIEKIKNCDFEQYFGLVQTSEDAGVQKPHVDIFHKVLSYFNTNPNNAFMIGDNLETDIAGADKTGISSVLFDPKNEHQNYRNKKINNLIELKKWL